MIASLIASFSIFFTFSSFAKSAAPPIGVTIQTSFAYQIESLAFSPNGQILAAAGGMSEKAVRLWDVSSRRLIRTIPEQADLLAFTSDSRLLRCSSSSGRLGSWSVVDGGPSGVLTTGFNTVISGDGRIAAGDRGLADFEIMNLETSNVIKLPKPWVPIALSHTGRWLAARTGFQTGTIWDCAQSNEVCSFDLPRNLSGPAQFGMQDSVLVFASTDGTLTMLNNWAKHPTVYRQKLPSGTQVFAIGQSADALVAVGINVPYLSLAAVNLYNPRTGQLVKSNSVPNYSGGPLCFSPDGKYLAMCIWNERPVVTLWDSKGEQELAELRGSVSPITSVICGPGTNTLISAGSDGMTCFWDLLNGCRVKSIIGTNFGEQTLALSPDGRTVATAVGVNIANQDYGTIGYIERLSLPEGQFLPPFKDSKGPTWCLAYSPDGSLLAAGRGETFSGNPTDICLWDTATGQITRRLKGHTGAVRSVAFTQDGKTLVSAGDDATVRVWSVSSGSLKDQFHTGACQDPALAISPDDRWVAVAATSLYVWDLKTGNLVLTTDSSASAPASAGLPSTALPIYLASSVAFSPRDSTLAVGTELGDIHLVDLPTKTDLYDLRGHLATVTSLSYSADGKTLASGSLDGSVRIWNMPRKELLASLVAAPPDEYVIINPQDYYRASKNVSLAVAFSVGARAYSFDQFDLVYNRPDKVLESLGGDPETVASLRDAWRSRIALQGFDPDKLSADTDTPQVELISSNLPVSTTNSAVEFTFEALDSLRHLARLQVSVNNVPEYKVSGLDVSGKSSHSLVHNVKLQLLHGENHVEFWAINEDGVESLRQSFEITCTAPSRPGNLYYVGIGVTAYANADYNTLEFPAKDAADLGSFFKEQPRHFANIYCCVLTNSLATRSNILASCSRLTQCSPEDEVVLFFSGHGKMYPNRKYFFGTYDIDFDAPDSKGLSYENIEGLLDGVLARKKLVLIDTCQAGEVDPASAPTIVSASSGPVDATRMDGTHYRVLEQQNMPVLAFRNSLTLVQELFSDLRPGAGEHVIVAVKGSDLAGEREHFQNGIFTHYILEGLRSQKADENGEGSVSVGALTDYVTEQVQEITGGSQTPTVRRDNVEFDFPIY